MKALKRREDLSVIVVSVLIPMTIWGLGPSRTAADYKLLISGFVWFAFWLILFVGKRTEHRLFISSGFLPCILIYLAKTFGALRAGGGTLALLIIGSGAILMSMLLYPGDQRTLLSRMFWLLLAAWFSSSNVAPGLLEGY